MKPTIQDSIQDNLWLKEEIKEQLEKVLKGFGVPDKERKVNFNLYDDPSLAALCAYEVLKEFSEVDKTYFQMEEAVTKLYGNISRTLKPVQYQESSVIKELKDQLKNLSFNAAYYRNQVGFTVTKEGVSGYVFDNSLGSATTKTSTMIKAAREFELFSLTPRFTIKMDLNIPSKDKLEEYGLVNEFLAAVNSHKIPELVDLAVEYGLVEEINPEALRSRLLEKDRPVGQLQSSSIFGDK